MCFAVRGTTLSPLAFVSFAVIGVVASACLGDEPSPEEVLRDNGLTLSGGAYVVRGEDDLRDRVEEIGERFAEWKRAKAELDEQLEALRLMRLQYQDVARKLRAIETGGRPDSQDRRPLPFPGVGLEPPDPGIGRFHPGAGLLPPPPNDMSGFGPGPPNVLMRQLRPGDHGRQYNNLKAERTARGAEIIDKQLSSEDLVRRLEAQLHDIELRRVEAEGLAKEIQALYDKLASERRVERALDALNEAGNPKVSLGRGQDYAKDLAELADALVETKKEMLQNLAQVELKGLGRLTGLVAMADSLLQELGIDAGRMQNLEREAISRKNVLADEAKHQASLAEQLRRAASLAQKNQIAAEIHAKETRVKSLHAQEVQSRQADGEITRLLASRREDYLRIVEALQDAVDEADKERQTSSNDTKTAESRSGPSRAEGELDEIGSTEPFKRNLKEFAKTIRSESVPIDVDKTINWIEVALNGKSGKMMVIDLVRDEIRVSARLAVELGVHLAPDDPVVEIRTVDGRHMPARRARLDSVQVGPFTQHDVECFVLPESAGEVAPLLGAAFFHEFSTRIDSDACAIVLTQVHVKPIHHSTKGLATKSAGAPSTKKTAPATGRSTEN
jgi:gag-polyprotein putative aspartyl protease